MELVMYLPELFDGEVLIFRCMLDRIVGEVMALQSVGQKQKTFLRSLPPQ